ncbi:hypothetical protein H261_22173 [Paramagnetospirillum caucaseum]|uniref:Uncharacterized protein n=1 Tax=Paramagnetospirillum caucaseum TaxID=1244869 RepID=M2Y3P7_9PROT|nr:tetratricopeptide repeat protein [Paramagnetospirillum caucaseum]EME67706.1 hypothetical protein H261_22173 [Paramagnetospirillum caucaseum]
MKRAGCVSVFLAVCATAGCSGPSYVDEGAGERGGIGFNEVKFRVDDSYRASPPECVAILPLKARSPSNPEVTLEDAARVRLSVYAHLSAKSKRGVRLERVDRVFAETKEDRAELGKRLRCGALLEGEVTESGTMFLALYSRVSVGAELRLIRAADGVVLWEGKHVAASHGGSLPLDPVGVAMGILDAVNNVGDEQLLRVTDDLARRLVSTIPDEGKVALEDPSDNSALPLTHHAAAAVSDDQDPLALGERLMSQGDHAGALVAADRALLADSKRSEAWFLKGRVLMLEGDYPGAETAALRAVSLDRRNARYLNALGAANAANGSLDRALAAYEMAVAEDPSNGFAWFNSAIILIYAGNPNDAADAFYAAGLAYIKTGDAAKAERALGELKLVVKTGVAAKSRLRTLEDALSDLARRKTS